MRSKDVCVSSINTSLLKPSPPVLPMSMSRGVCVSMYLQVADGHVGDGTVKLAEKARACGVLCLILADMLSQPAHASHTAACT